MSNQNITISFTGKDSGLSKTLNSGQQKLLQFNQTLGRMAVASAANQSATIKLRSETGRYTTAVKEARLIAEQLTREKAAMAAVDKLLTDNLTKQQVQMLRSTGVMQNMAHANGSASFALLSLGQAFQDSAQFGMGFAQGLRAVNNNIQQTFTAIALGAAQVGGFGNLLKQMGTTLKGPAGLIIGFSILSAGLEFFSTRAQRAKKETEDLGEAWDDASGKLFKFEDALSGMSIGIPERAITPIREELERTIKGYDDVISKAEETLTVQKALRQSVPAQGLAGVVSVPQFEQLVQLSKEEIENNQAIIAAKETVAGYDMDRIEGERRLLSLLVQQEGFLDKRNQLLEIARGLGLSLEDTSKRTLTTIQKMTEEFEDLVKAFGGGGEAERQQGALQARIGLLKGLRDATIDYSESIEEMRIAMSQEGVIVLQETARIQKLNKEAQERVRLLQATAVSGLSSVSEFLSRFRAVDATLSRISENAVITQEKFAELFSTGELDSFIEKMREQYAVETDLDKVLRELRETRLSINSIDRDALAIKTLELDLTKQYADEQQRGIQLKSLLSALQSDDEAHNLMLLAQVAALRGVNEELEKKVRLKLIEKGYTEDEIEQLLHFSSTADDAASKTENALDRINKAFSRAAIDGIAMFSEGLFAMAIGGESFTNSILVPLADMSIRLGKIAIATGITMKGIRNAFKNPATAIAAGIALIAVGSAVKAAVRRSGYSVGSSGGSGGGRVSAPNAFTTGGGVAQFSSGGVTRTLFPVGGSLGGPMPTAINFPGLLGGGYGGSGSMRVQLVASGRDLVGAIDSELYASGRSTSTTPFVSVGSGQIIGNTRDNSDRII